MRWSGFMSLVSLRNTILSDPTAPSCSQAPSVRHQTASVSMQNTVICDVDQAGENMDDCESQTATQVVRHADLWFHDGSVICQAENTLFRVHMSQLSRHSLCFRDMFSLPQPKDICEEKDTQDDRVPVVVLHDSAEDVSNLFTALYDGPYVMLSLKSSC